jgi:hypothetical protein
MRDPVPVGCADSIGNGGVRRGAFSGFIRE